jgi:carbon-monoxide dehydrogenase medium subunit
MFPADLDYRRAQGVEDALAALTADDRLARPLAGGQGLVQDMKAGAAAPDLVVDVSGVDALAGLSAGEGGVEVGALVTHADLAGRGAAAEAPVLPATARALADRQVRNRGTVGGNLAEADPAADLPAAVLAAGSTLHLVGPDGERAVPAGDFFGGDGETALADDELLASVTVPAHDRGAYEKKTHPATGYAMIGVAVAADVDGGTVVDPGVAVTGLTDRPTRLSAVEAALAGTEADAVDPAAAADGASDDLEGAALVGDAHASAAFRAEVAPTHVARAIDAALSGGERA